MNPARLVFALVFALLWTSAGRARAELTIQAELGFDGFYIPGEWTPVEVLLSNQPGSGDTAAPVDYQGHVNVVSPSFDGRPFTYSIPADLPANSQKRFWLVIKVAAPQLNTPPMLDVEFRADNRRGRVVTQVQGQAAPGRSTIVLVVRDPGAPEAVHIPGVSGSQSYTLASVSALPDTWAALSSVTAIFMTRSSPLHLGEGEVAALRTWVQRGGVLVVDGGAGPALNQSSIADLLPVLPSERSAHTLTPSNRFEPVPAGTNPLPPNSVVLLNSALAQNSSPLWTQGDEVLAASRPLGLGQVAFVAWDLPNPQMSRNARAMALISGLMPPPGLSVNHDTFHQLVLQNIAPDPSIATPSLALVFILLIGYWVVVGPWNYVWLRKQSRIEWAWVTIPIIIAAFCVLFYGIGYLTRSNKDSLRHINVAFVNPGVPVARVEGISLHFSAAKQRIDFTPSRPDSTMSQIAFWSMPTMTYGIGNMTFGARNPFPQPGFGMPSGTVNALRDIGDPTSVTQTDEGMRLDDQLVRQWSLAYLETSGPADMGGAISTRCIFGLDPNTNQFVLRGSVVNETPARLTHCAVLWGNRAHTLTPDTLEPGASINFEAPWSPAGVQTGFKGRDEYDAYIDSQDATHIRRAVLRAVMLDDVELPWLNPRSGQPLFVAYTDRPLLDPEPSRAVERPADSTLIVTALPVEVTSPTPFQLDSACLPMSYSIHAATDDAVSINADFNQNQALMMHDSQVVLTYRLPWAPGVESQVGSVTASINFSDSQTQWVQLFALDRTSTSSNPWIAIPTHLDTAGAGGMPITGPQRLDPARVVDPITGEITLLVRAERRPELPEQINPQSVTVSGLSLTVGGLARPAAAEPPNLAPQENAT